MLYIISLKTINEAIYVYKFCLCVDIYYPDNSMLYNCKERLYI